MIYGSIMFKWQARRIQQSPNLVLAVLAAVTVALLAGLAVQDPQPEVIDGSAAFLPDGSELAEATDAIRESFPASADLRIVQILAKGDVLAADSLRATKDLQVRIISDPAVEPFLVAQPLAGYVQIIEPLLAGAGLDLATVSDADVRAVLDQLARTPELAAVTDLLNRFVPRDGAGAPIAGISLVTLDDAGDALGQQDAQLRAHDIAESTSLAPLEVSVISPANLEVEAKDVRETSLLLLAAIALAVIGLLLAIFYRTQSDVHITMAGLGMTLLWTLGAQAWLSPGGAGIVERDNLLAALVPVLLISLTVDYALQITSRYREALALDGDGTGADLPGRSMGRAVRATGVPVLLAAGTTAVSLLANLTSKFEPVADFGIVAGIGLVSGWIVMTNFVPAARLALDRRRQAKGQEPATRPVADTIPGAAAILRRISAAVVHRPLPILAGVIVVTILATIAATNLDSTFTRKAFLPQDSETVQTLDFLEENFDGRATTMTLLIEADLDTVGTVRHLFDLSSTLIDPERRPDGIAGPPIASAGTLLADWTTDSGQPGDNYDPAIAAAFTDLNLNLLATNEDARHAWALLEGADPAGFAGVVDLRSNGRDRTILEIPVAAGSEGALQGLIEELDALWGGDASEITATGGDALTALINDELSGSQAVSVALTLAAALAILLLYFGLTDRRPVLGLITMVPIAAVLVWILGVMFVLGISYNVGTALAVVLAIGISVDYTIHLTHRFLEEERESQRVGDALRRAMDTTGGALLASALTTGLGFLVLLASPVRAMQELAVLVAVVILLALVATFTVLPPLLVLWAHYHRWRAHEADLESDQPSTAA